MKNHLDRYHFHPHFASFFEYKLVEQKVKYKRSIYLLFVSLHAVYRLTHINNMQ